MGKRLSLNLQSKESHRRINPPRKTGKKTKSDPTSDEIQLAYQAFLKKGGKVRKPTSADFEEVMAPDKRFLQKILGASLIKKCVNPNCARLTSNKRDYCCKNCENVANGFTGYSKARHHSSKCIHTQRRLEGDS